MASQQETQFHTFTAGAALAKFRQVKLDSTNDRQVVATGAGEKGIGITQNAASASGERVTVKLYSGSGTYKVEAGLTIGTRNGLVYSGASGRLSSTGSGNAVGRNLDTPSGTGSIFELMPVPMSENDIGALTLIDDDSGGTNGGTLQLTTTVDLVDSTGGTDGGTGVLSDVLSAQTGETGASGLLNGSTNGSTNSLVKIPVAGHSAGTAAAVGNNDSVLLTMINEVRADIASIVTAVNNNLAVIAAEQAANHVVLENNVTTVADQTSNIINAAG